VFLHLPEKAIPEMTYTVSGGLLDPTHSLFRGTIALVCAGKGKRTDEFQSNPGIREEQGSLPAEPD